MAKLQGCDHAMKLALFVLNFCFFALGCALLGLGLWMKLDKDAFHILEIMGGSSQDPFWKSAILLLMVVGGLVLAVSFFGCCGACKESSSMLKFYGFLMVVLVILQITAGVLAVVFRNRVGDAIRMSMYKQVTGLYTNETSDHPLDKAWNHIQQNLQCCGANNYTDYKSSNYTLRTNNAVPYTCCKLTNVDAPEAAVVQKCRDQAKNEADPAADLYTAGCYDQLHAWVMSKSTIIMGIAFGVAFIQMALIGFACSLATTLARQGS